MFYLGTQIYALKLWDSGIKHRNELKYLKEKVMEGKLNFNTPVMRKV
jgi:hypothetical protein